MKPKSFDPLINTAISITDCPHSTPNWTNTGCLVIRNFNIKNGSLNLSEKYFTDENTFFERRRRAKPEPGDLIITREAPMGEICMIPKSVECCLGQRMVLIKPNPKNIDNKFLLYAIQSEFVQKQIKKSDKTGSIVSNLRIPDLENLLIPRYDINFEKKVGEILSFIDSKIDLNNKINTELETTIKTLYDYWFVQFDFNDQEGKPYKSNGGKMIWRDELNSLIPENWEITRLKDLLEFEKGIEPGSSEYLESKVNDNCINFIRVGDIDGSSAIFIDTSKNSCVKVTMRDIIVTFDGSVGKLGVGLEGAISGGLRKIYDKNNKLDSSLIYSIFKDKRIISTIHKYATGSILLHASSSIEHLVIPYDENIYMRFQKLALPYFNKIVLNKKENLELYKLRRDLLKMLLNGQIKIN
jgi:type I restriction enzyme S subunit